MVDDIFGNLHAGGNGQGGGPRPDRDALEAALAGAALWGMELDPRFRVLAVTLEPTPERAGAWMRTDDRRIQLLCFPVSTIIGSLRRDGPDGRELLAFSEEQLVDVAATFGGVPVATPLFGRPEPRPGEWGPQFSLQGRSSAPDGTGQTLTVSVTEGELSLDLFARFDDLELKGPDGTDLPWPPSSPRR
ncbi:MAG: hypothetical protein EA388_05010 [Nitriliruptor sp.]|nr:MAG: hypothetical protein EA388_05010 [Nitriliruptor sp.]